MKKVIFFWIVFFALASCSNNDIDVAVDSSRQISFTSLNDKVSRAANADGSNYKVLAAMNGTPDGWYMDETVGTDNAIVSGKKYYWLSPAQDIDFWAYAPADVPVTTGEYSNYTLDFTVPAAADKDFTIASKLTQGTGTVNLRFKHALSRVSLALKLSDELATAGYTLNEDYTVDLTASRIKGSISPVADIPQWTLDNTTSSATYTGKLSYMIMPQAATGVTVQVKGVVIKKGGTTVFSGDLTGHTFSATDIPAYGSTIAGNFGMNTSYAVTMEIAGTSAGVFGDAVSFSVSAAEWNSENMPLPFGDISVSPSAMTFSSSAVPASSAKTLAVTCGASDPWTLTSSDSWVTLSLSPDGSNASSTVSGTGPKTVYLLSTANGTGSSRSTTITYFGSVVSTITQLGSALDPGSGAGTSISSSTHTYVGAFWKHDQVGERLIRIPVQSGAAGAWTAFVYYMDGSWSAGDIILNNANLPTYPADASASTALGRVDTDPVSGTATSVSGTASTSDPIYFRIGLKSSFAPTDAVPARYAIVAITYNNNSKIQLLYLRQGEDPDYLMRPTDGYGNNPGVTAVGDKLRPEARKFSAYNVTAATLNAQCNRSGSTNPSKFTAFPSQAGAFFQWANDTNPRYAYSPVGSATLNDGYPTTYWDALSSAIETSPENYLLSSGTTVNFRRPNDGITNAANSSGNVQGSEFRQSLWYSPQTYITNDTGNSLFGYYADGYFDRLATATSQNSTANSCVNSSDAAVAYVGNLFFNPFSGASLFFPAAGCRYSSSLNYTGSNGYYWSSSADGTSSGWRLYFYSGNANQSYDSRYIGFGVRPVLE